MVEDERRRLLAPRPRRRRGVRGDQRPEIPVEAARQADLLELDVVVELLHRDLELADVPVEVDLDHRRLAVADLARTRSA